MTSVTLTRNKKSDKQEKSEAKNTTKIKDNDLKEIIPKTDCKPSSIGPSEFTKYVEKQTEEEDRNTKSAISRIFKPIGSTFKEKSNIQSKSESRGNSQKNLSEGKATSARSSKKDGCFRAQENVPSKNGEIVTSSKEKRSDASAKMKAAERAKFEDDEEKKGEKDNGENDTRLSNGFSKNVKDFKECECLLVVQKYSAKSGVKLNQ